MKVRAGYGGPAGEVTRVGGLLTRIHPLLERVLGPNLHHATVLRLLSQCGGPAGLREAGRTKLTAPVRNVRAPAAGVDARGP